MNNELMILISNAVTGIVAWVVGRRKQTAEVENQVLRNLELSINLYKEIIDSLKSEIESLNIRIHELEKKIDELHEENKLLKGYGKGL